MAIGLGSVSGMYTSANVQVEQHADQCPSCGQGIQAQVVDRYLIQPYANLSNTWKLRITYRCPRVECQEVFIAHFSALGHAPSIYRLDSTVPTFHEKEEFDEETRKVSPRFEQIYNEALAAESHRLLQVAGGGFRKALEFLVKDYLKHKNAADDATIERIPLGTCIENYVSDQNVKACAKRAAWLGNDEIHYIRVWETKDLQDLKRLLQLTYHWIANELLTAKYESEMT